MIEISSKTYRWHPALESLKSANADPVVFDNLVSHCIDLGGTPTRPLVCKYSFESGEDYALISDPLSVDAYFMGYKYGTLNADVISDPNDVVAYMAKTIGGWGNVSPMHKSNFFHGVKSWLRSVSHPNPSDKTVGVLTGHSRSVVTNSIRLQKLDPDVQEYVDKGAIGQANARTLVSLDPDTQKRLAKMCVQRVWSFRELYAYAFPESNGRGRNRPVKIEKSPDVKMFERVMSENSGLNITFDPLSERMNQGSLNIKFNTLGELSRVLELVIDSTDSENQEGSIDIKIDSIYQIQRLFKRVVKKKGA
jgi:hypothetical protein